MQESKIKVVTHVDTFNHNLDIVQHKFSKLREITHVFLGMLRIVWLGRIFRFPLESNIYKLLLLRNNLGYGCQKKLAQSTRQVYGQEISRRLTFATSCQNLLYVLRAKF